MDMMNIELIEYNRRAQTAYRENVLRENRVID